MANSIVANPRFDLNEFKARQKATWESGDFGVVAKYIEPAAEQLMARVNIWRGASVLDVACGTGNLAMIAARKGCITHGIDIASNLISQAKTRASAENLAIDFREGDAEALPYPDASFDIVVSMFGVMFAPRPEVAGAELLRVTKPGGTIALANWTPEGFIGQIFNLFANFLPPTPSVPSPMLWGDPQRVHARLGPGVRELRFSRQLATMTFPFGPVETVEFFREFYGPTQRSFALLEEHNRTALRRQLEHLQCEHNVSRDKNRTESPAEYLQVIAIRS